MPLITDISDHHLPRPSCTTDPPTIASKLLRKQSTHSDVARSVLMNNTIPPYRLDGNSHPPDHPNASRQLPVRPPPHTQSPRIPANHASRAPGAHDAHDGDLKLPPTAAAHQFRDALAAQGVGHALSDTPMPTAPSSPRIPPIRQNSVSGSSTPRIRPTTLDIPGLTKSKVSPDGRIAQRDLGAKLLIVMVGLPARGKSYITKKMARYLNWLQHEARIFNVGERRRIAAGGGGTHNPAPSPGVEKRPIDSVRRQSITTTAPQGAIAQKQLLDPPHLAAKIFVNGEAVSQAEKPAEMREPTKEEKDQKFLEAAFPELTKASTPEELPSTETMDQGANFFDPGNRKAALLREQCAMETLDEAMDYLIEGTGSVAIMDATNSTLERRAAIIRRVRDRCGDELNVMFVESLCKDERLLESNMRLKLSGPDYKDKDPVASLVDFKKRVAIYEKAYVPLGDYEERNNTAYVQMIDVGRKVISHQIRGFIAAQAVYYLLNFNLAPRMIWITRHGESMDNVAGKIGGDSDLSSNGHRYGKAVTRFINYHREVWQQHQREKVLNSHFPPLPGDMSPPNPYFMTHNDVPQKSFCVWTSMLKRAIQTAQYFDEDEFDLKQMRMLDELNAGFMEGMTYEEIRDKHADEFLLRKKNKLHYRYPGPGGEGYLDIINRIRPVIVELERMTDHCLLVTHRSIARVLLAYFLGLDRKTVADIDCPLGMLYMLEPKPYGVDFKAYQYNPTTDWFDHLPEYKPRPAPDDSH
ncbi:putative 6-phosphofructo-2-kinase 1 [Diplodia seriata]|uniref:6-phosphofructo-2-kinase 1 n=1 Tax=Diplodia seriata TaxID=420778 RepID=A0A0G2ET94_9PEZI|nr:putative 6-phosphofructo-2-kinase 1 [Diplodia seriata]OMP85735.1 6-phosphofructo-2-kinase 1 [Diplodia seriata]